MRLWTDSFSQFKSGLPELVPMVFSGEFLSLLPRRDGRLGYLKKNYNVKFRVLCKILGLREIRLSTALYRRLYRTSSHLSCHPQGREGRNGAVVKVYWKQRPSPLGFGGSGDRHVGGLFVVGSPTSWVSGRGSGSAEGRGSRSTGGRRRRRGRSEGWAPRQRE